MLIGASGKIGSFGVGDPGQVLSVNHAGALAWITPTPGTLDEIPIAGALLGLVRSSSEDRPDSVAVNETGHMTVSNLNVAKLYVVEGDEWILQAGAAT